MKELIKKCLIKLNIDLIFLNDLETNFIEYKFNENDIKMFLAQTSHESNNFKRLEESFNYSPKRLFEVFTKKVKTIENAINICNQGKEAIANFLYGNRKDLGNIHENDGWTFRGRGIIQLTGRNNYNTYSNLTGLDLINNPDLLLENYYAVKIACCYYSNRGLLGNNNIKDVTKKINGGYNGLDDREKRYNLIKDL